LTVPALDYARVAELYDRYCVFEDDLAFWRSLAAGTRGPVLELMAGTGRVSLPLLADGTRLVCLDCSLPMLAGLRRKLRQLQPSRPWPALVLADVRRLPVAGRFELVLLPFQGLSELPTPEDRLATLRSAADSLADGGCFVCSAHDPETRLRSIDGEWHRLGRFGDGAGGSLEIALRGDWRPADRTVHGEQRLRLERSGGAREEVVVTLRFALPALEEVLELSARAGLRCSRVTGDYAGGPYRPGESPFLVVFLERR
jgi:SAM-dependent methyltransferase